MNDKPSDEEISRVLDALILKGLIEVNSIDPETGEFMYQVTPQLIEAMPWIAEETEQMFLELLDVLWIKGFVSMNKMEENPIVRITDKALDPDEVSKLTYEERMTLYSVMEAMRYKGEQ